MTLTRYTMLLLGTLLASAAAARAGVITASYDASVNQRYNYVTGSYSSITPVQGSVNVGWSDTSVSSYDGGYYTYTVLDTSEAQIQQPTFLQQAFPTESADPFGGNAHSAGIGTFGYVFDYTDQFNPFIQEYLQIYSWEQTRDPTDSSRHWYHQTVITLYRYTYDGPFGSYGTNHFVLTAADVHDLVTATANGDLGTYISFQELWYTYNNGTGYENYSHSFYGNIEDAVVANAVPEPSSLALLGIGVFGAGVSRARRRRR